VDCVVRLQPGQSPSLPPHEDDGRWDSGQRSYGPEGPYGPERPRRPRRPRRGERTGRRRRRIPLWAKLAAIPVVAGLVFRRAVLYSVLAALSAMLHVVGINVHLPHVRFGWPWQTITAGTTTNVDVGPWVLQKIEGISRPALGQANYTFMFTHKVSKGIGLFPCWYSATFYAVAHASATVDLNPGPAWWAAGTGHYQLQILARPLDGKPGEAAVSMVLPSPQLPQSASDVAINDIPSTPVSSQHSWTYPGLGCGMLLRPQFAESVLYSLAQQIAFTKAVHDTQITRPLISAAQTQATQTIRDNFLQPTLNAFGYTLERFTLRWAGGT
jgi:hypothetical protein